MRVGGARTSEAAWICVGVGVKNLVGVLIDRLLAVCGLYLASVDVMDGWIRRVVLQSGKWGGGSTSVAVRGGWVGTWMYEVAFVR